MTAAAVQSVSICDGCGSRIPDGHSVFCVDCVRTPWCNACDSPANAEELVCRDCSDAGALDQVREAIDRRRLLGLVDPAVAAAMLELVDEIGRGST